MRFVLGLTETGLPSWWLCDEDDALLAWAGETFDSLPLAAEAARVFRTCAPPPPIEVVEGDDGLWRWQTWRSSFKVRSVGPGATTRADVVRTAERVRADVLAASGP